MRIPSGKTDQVIYFVAVDSTDLKTRETGLTGFTVYRSRNGGAATVYTTPTITELSAANMPGVYALLVDEDTTIAASSDSEEYTVHITQAAMAPVTRAIELYRRDTTTGQTITVANGAADADIERIQGTVINTPSVAGVLEVDVTHFNGTAGTFAAGRPEVNTTHAAGTAWNSGAIGAATLAADTITAAKLAADAGVEIAAAVWNEDATGHQTQGTFGQAIGDPAADTNSIYKAVVTDAAGATVGVDIVAIQADTNDLQTQIGTAGAGLTALVDAIWDEATAGHAGAGTTGLALTAAGADPWSTALPGAYGAGTAGKIVGDNVNATISSRATQASLDVVDDFLDTEVAAIKAKTDQLNFTVANQVDANALAVTAAGVRTAVGLAAANLDTQLDALPTAAENATAVGNITLSELAAIPGASPAMKDAIALIYMALRNRRETTATQDKIENDAGTAIGTAALSDDGTTFTKGEYA